MRLVWYQGPNLQNIVRQCYDIRQVYDKFTIKRDLQKIVQESYKKHITKLRQNVQQLISCHTKASSMRGVIITIFFSVCFFT